MQVARHHQLAALHHLQVSTHVCFSVRLSFARVLVFGLTSNSRLCGSDCSGAFRNFGFRQRYLRQKKHKKQRSCQVQATTTFFSMTPNCLPRGTARNVKSLVVSIKRCVNTSFNDSRPYMKFHIQFQTKERTGSKGKVNAPGV